jgi:uncharacterized Zn finger protein
VNGSDSAPYVVTVTEDKSAENEFTVKCTCPNVRMGFCKHSVAVLYATYVGNTELRHDSRHAQKLAVVHRIVKYMDMVQELREEYPNVSLKLNETVNNVPLIHILWAVKNLTPEELKEWREAVIEKPDRYPPMYAKEPEKDMDSRVKRVLKRFVGRSS